MGDESAAVSRERAQDPELCGGEMNLVLPAAHSLVAKVDSQPIEIEDRLEANRPGAAEYGPEAGYKFARRKWLQHEVVCTCLESDHRVVLSGIATQDDQRQRAPFSNPMTKLHGIAVRELQFDDRSVGCSEGRAVERFLEIARGKYREARVPEHDAECALILPIGVAGQHPLAALQHRLVADRPEESWT
jgi:hypothetical protein